jgi:hypothetical protein
MLFKTAPFKRIRRTMYYTFNGSRTFTCYDGLFEIAEKDSIVHSLSSSINRPNKKIAAIDGFTLSLKNRLDTLMKENSQMDEKFWMVFAHNGRMPTIKHKTREKAVAESIRLSRQLNTATWVLEAVLINEPVSITTRCL